jgi:hypothetical protein
MREHLLFEARESGGGQKAVFLNEDGLKGNPRKGIPTNHLAIFLFLFTHKKQIVLFSFVYL